METFTIEHLSFAYPEQSRKVLDDICLAIPQGQFVSLCGLSGCGKTTLLRHLKPQLAPHGLKQGQIWLEGQDLAALDQRTQSARIGFVQQNPENQIVTDKVWHELAFGLESLGYASDAIRLKVAEMASFFGIQEWFYHKVTELSGGQKQLLNLAAIMTLSPGVLILDEPTSQLDPIAAADFLATLGRVNRELGTTILLTEHRLEEVLPLADRMLVLEQGKIIADGSPGQVGQALGQLGHKMFVAMPTPMRVYAARPDESNCPLTVREGRAWLDIQAARQELKAVPLRPYRQPESQPILELQEAWFKYEIDGPDVVKGASLKAYPGELLAVLGGNGTGKSTMLSLLSGLNRPYRGKVLLAGRPPQEIPNQEKYHGLLAVLPQNPQSLFVKKTVQADLYEMLQNRGLTAAEQSRRVNRLVRLCELEHLLEQHPYDLSGGEQQRLALAKVLLLEPRLLLVDEPTKGLDAEFKQVFAAILRHLLARGVAVVMVSHDLEFCAQYADRCALFFDGAVVSEGAPQAFFTGNSFYTTSANRLARHLLPMAVTAGDLIAALGGDEPPERKLAEDDWDDVDKPCELPLPQKVKPRQKGRRRTAIAGLSLAFLVLALVLAFPTLEALAAGEGFTTLWLQNAGSALRPYGAMACLVLFGLLLAVSLAMGRQAVPVTGQPMMVRQRKLPKRTLVAALMILLLIPLTIFIGHVYLGDRKYYFISLLIVLETMLPFVLVFEGRKPQARELVVIAVLCAIGVAGRAAFFMVPHFKPVAALVIIAGVAFGGEAGFLVGAVTGLATNFFFGQGPWTPWQMFAYGIIGFLAGLLFRKGLLARGRWSLAVFGAVSALIIYGLIMNGYATLAYQANPNWQMLLTHLLLALPFDLIHAVGTGVFLLLISQPMLEKLDRIKVKYGMLE